MKEVKYFWKIICSGAKGVAAPHKAKTLAFMNNTCFPHTVQTHQLHVKDVFL